MPTESPVPLRLPCPACGVLHVDDVELAREAHHTHCCLACGMVWRPGIVATVGVRFLPGLGEAKAGATRIFRRLSYTRRMWPSRATLKSVVVLLLCAGVVGWTLYLEGH